VGAQLADDLDGGQPYVADGGNNRVRGVDTSGTVDTVAG
jgi:hypothetical protein